MRPRLGKALANHPLGGVLSVTAPEQDAPHYAPTWASIAESFVLD